MKTRLAILIFLIILLTSCTPVVAASTTTPLLTITSAPPTLVAEPSIYPTPLPTEPPIVFMITPDKFQFSLWREYQTELARHILADGGGINDDVKTALCEWDILGRSGEKVYLWAICYGFNVGDSRPAVIYLNTDDSIQKVETPIHGSGWDADMQRMFPADVREKIALYFDSYNHYPRSGKTLALSEHLTWRLRRENWNQPPLIFFSATMSTPEAIPLITSILTPDAIQVMRWQEYQAELVTALLLGYNHAFDKDALCEWDILGRSDREVYVWAICSLFDMPQRNPVVIHLNIDGSIEKVEVPDYGPNWDTDIQRMFPTGVREKIPPYFSFFALHSGRASELEAHLQDRLKHPEEPPLIVLSTTPAP